MIVVHIICDEKPTCGNVHIFVHFFIIPLSGRLSLKLMSMVSSAVTCGNIFLSMKLQFYMNMCSVSLPIILFVPFSVVSKDFQASAGFYHFLFCSRFSLFCNSAAILLLVTPLSCFKVLDLTLSQYSLD